MTPEEKIEALRKLFDNIDGNIEELKQGAWWDGFHWTRQKVRDIIDPPKPKWREAVDFTARSIFTDVDPLADVLSALSVLAAGDDVVDSLAHVVAVCEAQAGDGWQADPACWGGTVTLHTLIDRLSCDEEDDYYTPVGKVTDWKGLGHAAAAWLRSLTDGGAA